LPVGHGQNSADSASIVAMKKCSVSDALWVSSTYSQ
jgi:hypothetical protein